MQWLTPCRSINASSIESISARRQLFRQAHCPAEDIAIYMEWKINVNLKCLKAVTGQIFSKVTAGISVTVILTEAATKQPALYVRLTFSGILQHSGNTLQRISYSDRAHVWHTHHRMSGILPRKSYKFGQQIHFPSPSTRLPVDRCWRTVCPFGCIRASSPFSSCRQEVAQ